MSHKLFIPVVVGTTREKRKTIHAAKLVHEELSKISGVTTQLVDVKDFFPLPGEGNDEESKHPEWVKINEISDGYVIVTPEYNHGYPGSLKMLLDNDLGNYTNKPVLVAGVSAGMLGGARVVENLLPVVRELGMIVSHSSLYFPHMNDLFDDSGELLKEDQRERVAESFEHLLWLAKTLKWGRGNISSD